MTVPAMRGSSKFLTLEFPGDESGTRKDRREPVSDAATGRPFGEPERFPGLLPGAWEAAREDKASRSGDRESFRPREGVLLTSPRKQRAVVSLLRPRCLPLLA